MAPFSLRAELFGHLGDVRSLCVLSPACFVSGSRDKTCRVWTTTMTASSSTTTTTSAATTTQPKNPGLNEGRINPNGALDFECGAVVEEEQWVCSLLALDKAAGGGFVSGDYKGVIRSYHVPEHLFISSSDAHSTSSSSSVGNSVSSSSSSSSSAVTIRAEVKAHDSQVNSLAGLGGHLVASGSWDGTSCSCCCCCFYSLFASLLFSPVAATT